MKIVNMRIKTFATLGFAMEEIRVSEPLLISGPIKVIRPSFRLNDVSIWLFARSIGFIIQL